MEGYKNLVTYIFATVIYDLTVHFCRRYINPHSRTVDQMEQAARSGKQNIAEGYTMQSRAGYIKLLGVAEGSLKELAADYEDFLRQRNFAIWPATDPRVRVFRDFRAIWKSPNLPNTPNLPNNPEQAANMLLTFCQMATYLLHKQIESLTSKFVKEGGFRENLFRKRLLYRRQAFTLIELTIVIALLAVLAAAVIALLNPWQQIGKANDAKRKHDLDVLKKVLEDYYNDKGCYPRPEQICYGGNPPAGFSNICTGPFGYKTPQWQTCYICGTESSSPSLSPYLNQLPCDPEHATKEYLYQVNSTTCTGSCPSAVDCTNMCPKSYILYSHLIDTADPAISQSGCNAIGGCGTDNNHNYQYGVASPNQMPKTPNCGSTYCFSLGPEGYCKGTYIGDPTCQTFYCNATDCCKAHPGTKGC